MQGKSTGEQSARASCALHSSVTQLGSCPHATEVVRACTNGPNRPTDHPAAPRAPVTAALSQVRSVHTAHHSLPAVSLLGTPRLSRQQAYPGLPYTGSDTTPCGCYDSQRISVHLHAQVNDASWLRGTSRYLPKVTTLSTPPCVRAIELHDNAQCTVQEFVPCCTHI